MRTLLLLPLVLLGGCGGGPLLGTWLVVIDLDDEDRSSDCVDADLDPGGADAQIMLVSKTIFNEVVVEFPGGGTAVGEEGADQVQASESYSQEGDGFELSVERDIDFTLVDGLLDGTLTLEVDQGDKCTREWPFAAGRVDKKLSQHVAKTRGKIAGTWLFRVDLDGDYGSDCAIDRGDGEQLFVGDIYLDPNDQAGLEWGATSQVLPGSFDGEKLSLGLTQSESADGDLVEQTEHDLELTLTAKGFLEGKWTQTVSTGGGSCETELDVQGELID